MNVGVRRDAYKDEYDGGDETKEEARKSGRGHYVDKDAKLEREMGARVERFGASGHQLYRPAWRNLQR